MENEKQNTPEILTESTPENAPVQKGRKKDDPVVIGLMFGVSFLCLCIIGVMVYWLTTFLM